jgi:PAS domain S-box-containing protein
VAEDNLTATQREIEYRIITPAGDVRWMLQLGSVKLDETGRPVSRSGVVQDITQQHKSREQLLLLEAAVAQLSDAVLITEADPVSKPGPRIVFVNHAFEKQTGYSWDEALGKTPRMLQGPNTQQSELQRISQALKACQPVGAELINYTKAGREFWVELEIIPIANTEGRCTHFVSVQRDITERKQAEAALIASEQRYAELFELAPVPMWVFDIVDHRFLNVNQAAIDNFGYSADEFKSMTIFDIREAPEQSELRDRLLNQAEPPPFSQYRRKDGSLLLVKVAYKPIEYAGRAARLVIGLDVTAQVNAEKGVQAQVLTLRRAADAAQAITWQQTIEGMLQEATEQARYVIEAHQCVISLTSDDDLPLVINALSLSDKYAAFKNAQGVFDGANLYDALSQNNGIVRMTQAELEAHPRWRDFENRADQYPPLRGWLAVPLTGRNGQNIGLLHLSDKHDSEFTLQDEYVALELAQLASIAIENTRLLEQVYQLNTGLEQKVAERTQALARQDALFRALAEQAPQVIWTADNRGDTNYFNRAWFELVGGSAESWTERKWVSVVHPDDREEIREKWMHAVATKTPFVGVRRLLGRDGNYHTMSYRASPVLDKHGAISFWVGIDADITEIKIIESALRLSNQELEAFSYSVSHDLRSPLNTIDGFSRLLAKNLTTEADSRAQHYLTRIQAGVAQMGQLIEELLLLAQVSRTELRHERVDLSDLSQSILQDWHVRDAHRHVTVHIEPGLVVQGDASLLRVLMENLLGNAWKFTAQRAEASISVGQQTDTSGTPVYFVRDNGAGFDMAYANKLFVAFQRLHAVSEFPGSGIGLATVSRVIGRHAGKVWADASPDYGATFFFTLPKVQITMKVDGLQGQIT